VALNRETGLCLTDAKEVGKRRSVGGKRRGNAGKTEVCEGSREPYDEIRGDAGVGFVSVWSLSAIVLRARGPGWRLHEFQICRDTNGQKFGGDNVRWVLLDGDAGVQVVQIVHSCWKKLS